MCFYGVPQLIICFLHVLQQICLHIHCVSASLSGKRLTCNLACVPFHCMYLRNHDEAETPENLGGGIGLLGDGDLVVFSWVRRTDGLAA